MENLWCCLGHPHLVEIELSSGFRLLCITADLMAFWGVFHKFGYLRMASPFRTQTMFSLQLLAFVL